MHLNFFAVLILSIALCTVAQDYLNKENGTEEQWGWSQADGQQESQSKGDDSDDVGDLIATSTTDNVVLESASADTEDEASSTSRFLARHKHKHARSYRFKESYGKPHKKYIPNKKPPPVKYHPEPLYIPQKVFVQVPVPKKEEPIWKEHPIWKEEPIWKEHSIWNAPFPPFPDFSKGVFAFGQDVNADFSPEDVESDAVRQLGHKKHQSSQPVYQSKKQPVYHSKKQPEYHSKKQPEYHSKKQPEYHNKYQEQQYYPQKKYEQSYEPYYSGHGHY